MILNEQGFLLMLAILQSFRYYDYFVSIPFTTSCDTFVKRVNVKR
jgi:hypothetical protein